MRSKLLILFAFFNLCWIAKAYGDDEFSGFEQGFEDVEFSNRGYNNFNDYNGGLNLYGI